MTKDDLIFLIDTKKSFEFFNTSKISNSNPLIFKQLSL